MYKKILIKRTLVIIISFLFIGVVVAPTISSFRNRLMNKNTNSERLSFNPFKNGWKYRKQITIDHTKVAGNLAYFPVLVSTIDSDLRDKAQIDGNDILFMDGKGEAEQLFHEIEYFDGSTGELIAWVNIPILSSSVDVNFYMYYGNLTCTSQEFPDLVWDSDYIHVWHMGDDLVDSAGSNDGINHGTDIISGKIGKSRDFEQSEYDFINLGDMLQPGDGSLTTMTWEGWVKPETQDIILMTKYDSSGSDYSSYALQFTDGGKYRTTASSAWEVKTDSWTVNSYSVIGEWIYLSSTFTLGGINNIVPFINGNEVADTQPYSNGNYMRNIPISDEIGRCRFETRTDYSDAVIDEIRWSKTVRSDEWIKTSFNTMNDPSNFINFGPEETKQKSVNNNIIYRFFDLCPLLNKVLLYFKLY